MVLRFVSEYRVTYILICIGALQYTMLIFRFPILCSLRQYIISNMTTVYKAFTFYFYYIFQPLQYHIIYINTHLSIKLSL